MKAIFFVSAFAGFLSFYIIICRNKEKCIRCVNRYLALIILFGAIRMLYNGLQYYFVSLQQNIDLKVMVDIGYANIGPTACVFYFSNLFHYKKTAFNKYIILNAILVCLFVIAYYLSVYDKYNQSLIILKSLLHLYALGCLIYIAYLGYFRIWRIKSNITSLNDRDLVLKKWTIFMTCSFFALLAVRILKIQELYFFKDHDSILIAIIWLLSFTTIILKPELLYGFDYLRAKTEAAVFNDINHLEEGIILLNEIWELNKETQEVVTDKDVNLKRYINSYLTSYVQKIEHLSFHSEFFRKPTISIDDLSSELKIPKSHIAYLFKFHCSTSFSNYKKMIKIKDAIQLMDTDYIKNNTFEALSIEVGFTSYTSFFTAFKDITGKSPQEYLK